MRNVAISEDVSDEEWKRMQDNFVQIDYDAQPHEGVESLDKILKKFGLEIVMYHPEDVSTIFVDVVEVKGGGKG